MNKNTTISVILVLERIKKELGFERDKQLYEKLGIGASTYSAWKVRGTMDYKMILEFCLANHMDLEYAFFGNSPKEENIKAKKATDFFDQICNHVREDINPELEEIKSLQEKILMLLHKEEIQKEISSARKDIKEKQSK